MVFSVLLTPFLLKKQGRFKYCSGCCQPGYISASLSWWRDTGCHGFIVQSIFSWGGKLVTLLRSLNIIFETRLLERYASVVGPLLKKALCVLAFTLNGRPSYTEVPPPCPPTHTPAGSEIPVLVTLLPWSLIPGYIRSSLGRVILYPFYPALDSAGFEL